MGANDKPRAGELINVLREAKQAVPEELLKFGTTGVCAAAPLRRSGGAHVRDLQVTHPCHRRAAVKKRESKLYGAHFREDLGGKSTKITFDDSDGDE